MLLKRMIYIAEVVPGEWRGNVLHVAETVRALKDLGVDLTLWVPDRGKMPDLPVPTEYLHTPRRGPWAYPAFSHAAARRIAELPADRLPDLVYQRFSGGGYHAPLAARRRGIPIVSEHNTDLGLEACVASAWWHRTIYRRLATSWQVLTANRSDLNVVLTEELAQLLRAKGVHAPMRVLPVGVDVKRITPRDAATDTAAIRRTQDLGDDPIILLLGNMSNWQGIDVLPEMMRVLLRSVPNARLLVVGEGNLGSWLRAEAETIGDGKRIIVTGWVSDEEVRDWLQASQIGLLPRPYRMNAEMGVSPMKLFTMMAAGLPIVCTRLPGLDFIEQEGCGVLTPPEDATAMANTIVRLLNDEPERQRMGLRSREIAVRDYDWHDLTLRLVSWLDELIAARATA